MNNPSGDNTTPTTDSGANPAFNSGTNPKGNPANPTTPGTPNTGTPKPGTPANPPTTTMSTEGMRSYVGYAEAHLVLGDSILQESIMIPDLDAKTAPGDSMAVREPGKHSFRGVSYLGFDAPSRTFTMTFMDSRSGRICYDTGSFEASENEITFQGHGMHKGKAEKMEHADHEKADHDKANREDHDKARAEKHEMGEGMAMEHRLGDVRVVLEILGPDQHRVTMYRDASPMNKDEGSQPRPITGSDGDHNPAGKELASNVVYRATYTRARGDDASKYKTLLREHMDLSGSHANTDGR
jgi:hypothetical protein